MHVSEVSRGLECGCFCEECGKSLIAKKGKERVHHFAHTAETECAGSLETILHLLAKEIFKELPTIFLPQYIFEKTKKLKFTFSSVFHRQIIVKGGEAVITKVNIEKSEGKFKPDITLESNTKTLFIEIAVSHRTSRDKLRHIRKRGLPAIEIHLDVADARLTKSELKDKLQKDLKSKKWLFHPNQRNAEKAFLKKFGVLDGVL